MCEFKRPALSTAQPLPIAPDIYAIDGRLDHLRGVALSSAYARQRESMKKEFSAFLCSLPGARLFFQLLLKMFVDFLLGKIPEGKHRSMFSLARS